MLGISESQFRTILRTCRIQKSLFEFLKIVGQFIKINDVVPKITPLMSAGGTSRTFRSYSFINTAYMSRFSSWGARSGQKSLKSEKPQKYMSWVDFHGESKNEIEIGVGQIHHAEWSTWSLRFWRISPNSINLYVESTTRKDRDELDQKRLQIRICHEKLPQPVILTSLRAV